MEEASRALPWKWIGVVVSIFLTSVAVASGNRFRVNGAEPELELVLHFGHQGELLDF
jgi:hypothetical protein